MNTIEKQSIAITFQLSKTKLFNVNYYRCGSNENKYFTTSASIFARNKRDYTRCGQCQKDVLIGYTEAKNFFKKWDTLHLKDLTKKQYTEMILDLESLKDKYNYISHNSDDSFTFNEIVEFSKQELK